MNPTYTPEWKRFGDAVRHRRRDGGQLQDDRRQTNAFSRLGSGHFEQLGKLGGKGEPVEIERKPGDGRGQRTDYRSARIIRCGGSKIDGTPPYSSNPWAELAQIFFVSPSGGYFQGHRGDF